MKVGWLEIAKLYWQFMSKRNPQDVTSAMGESTFAAKLGGEKNALFWLRLVQVSMAIMLALILYSLIAIGSSEGVQSVLLVGGAILMTFPFGITMVWLVVNMPLFRAQNTDDDKKDG